MPSPRTVLTILLALLLPFVFAATAAAVDDLDVAYEIAAGGRLRVEAESASVVVETASAKGVEIRFNRGGDSAESIRRDWEITTSVTGNEVLVEVKRKRRLTSWFGGWRALEITARVPRRFDADITTSGGSIRIADLDGSVTSQSSGGSLRFASIRGPVHGRTSGGSITIERCEGNTDVRTSGGSITIDEIAGAIDAQTSGGSIRATLTRQPAADSRLVTSGGSIVVSLDQSIALDLDASTSGGRVSSEIDVLARVSSSSHGRGSLRGKINGGGPELYLHTSGGGIRIARR